MELQIILNASLGLVCGSLFLRLLGFISFMKIFENISVHTDLAHGFKFGGDLEHAAGSVDNFLDGDTFG